MSLTKVTYSMIEGAPPNVLDFGAVGNGVTDDTAALQAYADYLATLADQPGTNSLLAKNHPTFYLPPSDGFKITAPLIIGKNISVICDSPILVDAAASAVPTGGAWVRIGEETVTANRTSRNCEYVLDVRRLTLSDWSSASDVGVSLLTAASKLWIRRIDSFAIGVKLTAPYSVTTLGEFRDCQIGLDVTWTAIDFANQELFLGGEFAVINGSNNGLPRYGVRLTNGPATSDNGNSIVFIGPSFELSSTAAGSAECIPFLVNSFRNIRVRDVRTENSSVVLAKLTGDTRWFQANLIFNNEFTYPSAGLLVDQSTYKIGNRAWIDGGDYDFLKANLVFDSGNFVDAITFYGSSSWHIQDMESALNTDPATFALYASITAVDYKNRQVTLGTAPTGVRVNTKNAKQFSVVVDGVATKNINLAVLAFDANGNQLTANTDVLQNVATPTVTPNTGIYGGLYSMSTALDDTRRAMVLTFSSNVETAFIGISGTSGIVRSMKIYAINGLADYFSKSALLGKDQRLANAAPTSGAYTRGQQVWNTGATAGGVPGWVCVTTGQFGTLVGVTAGTTSGSRSVVLSDVTNLWVGCAITIAGVSGTKIIEALEGTTAFVDSNCDASVTAGAVAYVTPVFKAMANLAV